MNKLMLGFPLYHQVPSRFFARYLSMTGQNIHGYVVSDGVYLPIAMQTMVSEALAVEGWDRLLIMEHDTLPPTNAFERVGLYEKEHDIVGSMYFRHEPPHDPLCYIQEPDNIRHNPLTQDTVKSWCDNPALYECGAVGFGFTSIARHVLENWDKSIKMFDINQTFASHDLYFCYHARQQGFKVYIDTAMMCDHLTQVPIGYADNQKCASMIKDRQIVTFGEKKQVLNVGGVDHPQGYEGWILNTLDIDERKKPDFVMDARNIDLPTSYDAIYCSHALEHFNTEDVMKVLGNFNKVLKKGGKVHIKVPDLDSISDKKEDEILYVSPAGPITPKDIREGHQASIKSGNEYMRHFCGFNQRTLKAVLKASGFKDIQIKQNPYELEAHASNA